MSASSQRIELLNSVEEISPDWVRMILGKAGMDAPPIGRIDVAPIGHGNTSDTFKLTLEYQIERGNCPAALILKIHNANPETVARACQAGVYRCEHEMSTLLRAVPGLSAPRTYHSAISDDGARANLVMEDLSATCAPGDQIAGISEAQALSAVREMLKLHLHFWRSVELDTYDWLIGRLRFHHEGAAMLKQRLASVLTKRELQIIDASLVAIDDWIDLKPKQPTMVHGDCRADNILFRHSGDGVADAFVIDWATATMGEAIADIAYLIVSSVRTDIRPNCERKALALCTEQIARVEPGYTLAMAQDAYRRNVMSSMHMTMLAGLAPPSPHVENLLATLTRRNCAALVDWLEL